MTGILIKRQNFGTAAQTQGGCRRMKEDWSCAAVKEGAPEAGRGAGPDPALTRSKGT